MFKMVDGTGIIGVDMICPLGVSTPQPPNYDRVELEGTGILVLPNSLDAPLERLELGGKTEQVQTTGAQLFDIAKCPLEHNGISFKIPKSSGDVVLMDRYVFEENTQYTISAQKTTSKNENSAVFKFEYVDGSRNEIKVKDIAKKSLTSMSGKTVKRFLVVNPFGAVDEVFNFQFEKGVTATPYEPYTGGKPSPSPEYPQEVKNAGKWNEETQKYEVDVKVTNAEQNWSKEQTLTLTSDRPITKWDKLVEQGGQIGWLYAGVVIDRFDGQSNKISIANKHGNVQNFSIRFENVANGNGNSDIFVDKYRAVQLSYTKAEYGICCNWNDGVKFFSAPNEKVTNLEEFKAWLIENPLGLAYETLETEFIPLPQSEQNAIRALKTYYPTTVITVDGGEVDPDIKVTYRKEI